MATRKKKKKAKNGKAKRLLLLAAIVVVVIAAALVCANFRYVSTCMTRYKGAETTWLYIPEGSDREAIADSMRTTLGDDYGGLLANLWSGDTTKAPGAYRVEPGDHIWWLARRISRGAQTPVKVSFNNVRTIDDLAERVCKRMSFSNKEFLDTLYSITREQSIDIDTFPAMLLPDTYEAYWTESPRRLLKRFFKAHDRFWNSERRSKAAELGLTPAQVATLASIVEEETSNSKEHGSIARLYLNRLNRGMKLQADPTVKFANGDFAARRITGDMLKKDSPYNTYRVTGLPPGPIRIASAAAIDEVLNSEPNDYIYMCANPDFSGTHLFAKDYATHKRNAEAYHKALDSRGIKK